MYLDDGTVIFDEHFWDASTPIFKSGGIGNLRVVQKGNTGPNDIFPLIDVIMARSSSMGAMSVERFYKWNTDLQDEY